MKIAISAEGKDLSALVHPRFGRCPFFILTDQHIGRVEVLTNSKAAEAGGAGIGAASLVLQAGAEAIISGRVGPKAFSVIHSARIPVYLAPEGVSVQEALDKLKAGELKRMEM